MQRFKDEGPRIRTPTSGRACGRPAIGMERVGREGRGGLGITVRRAGERGAEGRSPAAQCRGGRAEGRGSDAEDSAPASSGSAPPARSGSAP